MWRKLNPVDIQSMLKCAEFGLAARHTGLTDTPYNGVTIIGYESVAGETYLLLARPQAYACKFRSKQPMLYSEVFSMSAHVAYLELEVWESEGKLLRFQA